MGLNVIPGVGFVPDALPTPQKRKFENFLQAYREYSSHNEAPQKFHLWTALSIVAGVLEHKVWFPEYPNPVFPNLYVVLIGHAGSKKSTAAGMGADLLRRIPTIQHLNNRETDASMLETIRNSRKEFDWQGKKINHSSVFYYGSELATLLENPFGAITTYLTDLYDSRPFDIPWSKNTQASGLVKILGPNINMLGCATQTSIRDCIPVHKMEAGFASRILFVVETQASDKYIAVPKDNKFLRDFEKDLLNDLLIMHSLVGEMRFDSNADKYFEDWYIKYRKAIDKEEYDLRFAGYYARKPAMIKKLMQIFSVMESSSLIIQPHHIQQAIMIMEDNEEKMFRIFELSGNNPQIGVMAQIIDYIRDMQFVSAEDIQMRFARDMSMKDTRELLIELTNVGQLHQVQRGSKVGYIPVVGAPSLYGDRKMNVELMPAGIEPSDESEQHQS